jgi:RNA polymerase sigma-70 factor (ECF subfamily)
MKDKEQIFLDFIRDNNDCIYRIIWSFARTKADREDLYQDVLLKVWKGFEGFQHASKATTWLYRVTLNTCLDDDRRKRRKEKSTENQIHRHHISGDSDVEQEYIENEQLSTLHQYIQLLSAAEKSLITLYLEDLKYSEIAKIIGISERHVAVKISRIKKKLSKMIGEDEKHG